MEIDGKRLLEILFGKKPKIEEKTCDKCSKRKTIMCPGSELCYDSDNKPHWEH